MYWIKWRCHTNDAGALYRVIITVKKVVKKLAKTEPKQMSQGHFNNAVSNATVSSVFVYFKLAK